MCKAQVNFLIWGPEAGSFVKNRSVKTRLLAFGSFGGFRLAEGQSEGPDFNLVLVPKQDRFGHATSVQIGSVAASEVHQPKLVLFLRLDKRMAA